MPCVYETEKKQYICCQDQGLKAITNDRYIKHVRLIEYLGVMEVIFSNYN
jgi:hypothetical protein